MSLTNGQDPEGLQKAILFTDFFRMLERGQLNEDMSNKLREVAAAMENHAMENGGDAKAELSLKIKFKLEKGVYDISVEPKVKLPEPKRDRTIAWVSPENFFCPQDPRQLVMFGKPREVADPIFGTGAATAT